MTTAADVIPNLLRCPGVDAILAGWLMWVSVLGFTKPGSVLSPATATAGVEVYFPIGPCGVRLRVLGR
jgi:hypothetical protein